MIYGALNRRGLFDNFVPSVLWPQKLTLYQKKYFTRFVITFFKKSKKFSLN